MTCYSEFLNSEEICQFGDIVRPVQDAASGLEGGTSITRTVNTDEAHIQPAGDLIIRPEEA